MALYGIRPAWILATAFVVRMIAMLGTELDLAREAEMGVLARNILAGKGFSITHYGPERPTAAYPPFEGYFYALIHALGGESTGSLVLIIVIRSLLSVATAYVVYRIASRVYDARIGTLALYATAFHPAFIYFSSVSWVLVRPPYSMFVVSLLMLALVRLAADARPRNGMAVGSLFGVAALVQPDILTFLVVSLAWMAWVLSRRKGFGWPELRTLGYVPVFCLLVLSPWTLRNYLVMDEFILLRTDHGTQFWIGNNPVATGDFSQIHGLWRPYTTFDVKPAKTLSPEVLERVRHASEGQRDRILFGQALRFIEQNPGKFLELSAKRLRNFWLGPPKPKATVERRLAARAFALYSLALLGCALVGTWVSRRKPESLLFLLLMVTYTGIHGIAHASYYYYRMIVEPYAVLLALVGAVSITMRLGGRASAVRETKTRTSIAVEP